MLPRFSLNSSIVVFGCGLCCESTFHSCDSVQLPDISVGDCEANPAGHSVCICRLILTSEIERFLPIKKKEEVLSVSLFLFSFFFMSTYFDCFCFH